MDYRLPAKAVAADFKAIYQVVSVEEAKGHLEEFAATWDDRYR